MDWQEFNLSRQLIAEERYGKAARAVIAEEDALFSANQRNFAAAQKARG